MICANDSVIHETIESQHGVNTRSLEFRTVSNQREALTVDVSRLRSYPLLKTGVTVTGAIYNVNTGHLEPIDC